jgi:hypothetical protein
MFSILLDRIRLGLNRSFMPQETFLRLQRQHDAHLVTPYHAPVENESVSAIRPIIQTHHQHQDRHNRPDLVVRSKLCSELQEFSSVYNKQKE